MGLIKLENDTQFSTSPCYFYVAEINSEIYKLGITKDLKQRSNSKKYSDYLWTRHFDKRADCEAVEFSVLMLTYFARVNQDCTKKPRGKINETRLKSLLPLNKAISFITWNIEMVDLYGWHDWWEAWAEERWFSDAWLNKPSQLSWLN